MLLVLRLLLVRKEEMKLLWLVERDNSGNGRI